MRPAFGPPRLDPRAGGVLIGARPLLIAFNIELATGDLVDAQAIAAAIRESSGGMQGVQALGLQLPRTGRVQVSINVIDVEARRSPTSSRACGPSLQRAASSSARASSSACCRRARLPPTRPSSGSTCSRTSVCWSAGSLAE